MYAKIHIDKQEILNAIDKKMDAIADDVFAKSQEFIVQQEIVDEGTLLKTGNLNRTFLEKTVVYPVPYADTIENGSMPGEETPDIESLEGWVKRKLGVTNQGEARYIAKRIAKDLKENGRQPRPFLGPAIESVKNRLS